MIAQRGVGISRGRLFKCRRLSSALCMPKLDDKRTTPYFYRLFAPGAGAGPGIDPKDRERVFQAFYTTKSSGVGMGLSICRSIIEAHGGRLWADANEPRGAVFQFTLSNAENS